MENRKEAITYSEFKNMVEVQLPKLQETQLMDSVEAVNRIKLYNTIYYYSLNDLVFTKYRSDFDRFCLNNIVKEFDCKVSVGMGYYCPKQNIFIGGSSLFVEGSYYKLDSLTLPHDH